jgi:hypothetical protein
MLGELFAGWRTFIKALPVFNSGPREAIRRVSAVAALPQTPRKHVTITRYRKFKAPF